MGSFVFRWPHPANDVYVTGTFDDWGKSVHLERKGNVWEKEVDLHSAEHKILYKFVVDDQWITDHTAPQEDDGHWNVNNVLYPHQITRRAAPASGAGASTISSAAPGSTTAALAASAPLEKDVPGAYPETPAQEPDSYGINPIPASSGIGNPVNLAPGAAVPHPTAIGSSTISSSVTTSKEDYEKAAGSEPAEDSATYGVNPLPASSGIGNPISLAPGQSVPHSSTIGSNTIGSSVTTSKEDYERAAGFDSADDSAAYGVNPLPATSGMGNPISLAPGAPVPHSSTLTPHTVESTVTTSKEDYENAGNAALPVGGVLGGVFGGALGGAALGGLTAGSGSTIQSSGPSSTTAQLAGDVPLEKKRQAMVIDPEDVPNIGAGSIPSSVPGVVRESVADSRQAPEALTSPEAVKDKAAVEKEMLAKIPSSDGTASDARTAADQSSFYGLATTVPKTVEESMSKSHASPEAAADVSVVAEKSAVEQELLNKVPTTNTAGEPAPTVAAATSATAPVSSSTAADTATSLTDGKTANQTVPDTDTSTATRGPSAGALAGGAAAGGLAATAAATAASKHKDADVEPPRVADSIKPDVTTERSPAAVSSVTTPDKTLADEPAVQMMKQNETLETGSGVAPVAATPSTPTKTTTADKSTSTPTKSKSAKAKSKLADEVGQSPEGVKATSPVATKATTTKAVGKDSKSASTTPAATPQTKKTTDALADTPQTKKSTGTPAAASTPASTATPTKLRVDGGSNASSPAGSNKEAKKKNRISKLIKKIFD